MDYNTDYYTILRVSKSASKEELKAAYRKLAKLHHPDKNPDDPVSTERFRLIQEAYDVLSNEIKRHIYDEYRTANKKEGTANPATQENKQDTDSQNKKTYRKTRTVTREERIYVVGSIQVKFQGEPEPIEVYMAGREQHYTIHPTETLARIHSSGIYKDGTPREYERAYSSADLFAAPVVQPIQCSMVTGESEEVYLLTIHDLKIKDPVIENITRHEEFNFGELTGDFYGYIVQTYEEEVAETFTEYFGTTGRVDTKESAGVWFSRQEYYDKDGTRYWGEWKITEKYTPGAKRPAKTATTVRHYDDNNWKYGAWIIYLFIGLLIFPKLIAGLLLIIGLMLMVYAAGSFSVRLIRLVPLFCAVLIMFLLAIGVRSIFEDRSFVPEKRKTINNPPPETRKTANKDSRQDTLISHLVRWSDYDSNSYLVQLNIVQSAVRASHILHESIPSDDFSSRQPGLVYTQLYNNDTGKLVQVYHAFDSIVVTKNLDEVQAAKMVVSCIQSIPYYLVVDKACTAEYADAFVSNYLRNCQGDCCLGDVKFGVQSPAEFIGDLKGDCDTRALVLFDILSERGTDVALLTSQFYKHALIAVHFKNASKFTGLSIPINGENYYLWETTSAGHQPGEIPAAIGNLAYWNISLIHQQ